MFCRLVEGPHQSEPVQGDLHGACHNIVGTLIPLVSVGTSTYANDQTGDRRLQRVGVTMCLESVNVIMAA